MFKIKTMLSTLGASGSSLAGHHTKESLSEEVIDEVRQAAPSARLSYHLRSNLERLEKPERKEIVTIVSKQDSCAPLFIACKKGNLEIVEYLVEICGADIEQKGVYEVQDEKCSHIATPLWCAAVSGKLLIVRFLTKHGANVDAASDTGSTPVRSACFMTHFDVVKYLVEEGNANIHIPNINGGTCLINSVQSKELCEYLIAHGADVNAQDIQLKTALHYSIQEHRFEMTKLLLANKASPFLKNRYGDDALQTASLKGASFIFNYLMETVTVYSRERRAEMHELMGSTFLDEHHDIQMALYHWKTALLIRFEEGLPPLPKPRLHYVPLYAQTFAEKGGEGIIREFSDMEGFKTMSADMNLIRINSLLIAERILGRNHKDVIFRIMYRGAAYADSSQYLPCILLWRYTLQLRIEKDSIVYGDTCFTALALVRLLLDLDRNKEIDRSSVYHPLRVVDLFEVYQLLIYQLICSVKLIRIRPVSKRQQESFDKSLRGCTHLLYLLLKAPNKTRNQLRDIQNATERMVSHGLSTCTQGDSLLHLAVSRSNTVKSTFFVDEHQICVFPSIEVAQFLMMCGADVNALNDNRSTPLHLVVAHENCSSQNVQLVNLLLKGGTHVDQLDSMNVSPMEVLTRKEIAGLDFSPIQHVTLKCLSAKAVCDHEILFEDSDIPHELLDFLVLHRRKKR